MPIQFYTACCIRSIKYLNIFYCWQVDCFTIFLHLINNSDGPVRARGLTLILIILWVVSWKPPYTGWWDRMHRRHLITMVQLSSREFSWVYESAASEETQEKPIVACAHNFIRPTGTCCFSKCAFLYLLNNLDMLITHSSFSYIFVNCTFLKSHLPFPVCHSTPFAHSVMGPTYSNSDNLWL